MAIPDNKGKVEGHLLKTEIKELKKLAANEKRTLKNFVEFVLSQYIENNKKK